MLVQDPPPVSSPPRRSRPLGPGRPRLSALPRRKRGRSPPATPDPTRESFPKARAHRPPCRRRCAARCPRRRRARSLRCRGWPRRGFRPCGRNWAGGSEARPPRSGSSPARSPRARQAAACSGRSRRRRCAARRRHRQKWSAFPGGWRRDDRCPATLLARARRRWCSRSLPDRDARNARPARRRLARRSRPRRRGTRPPARGPPRACAW